MTDSKLIDSSVWLAYFFAGEHTEIIECDDILLLSAISLFEIKIPEDLINKNMNFLKQRSNIIDVNTKIAEKAIEIYIEYKLATIDSIIYASAISNNAILITRDNDFRGLPNVKLF